MKVGLVLEGGAMRGVYTAGVLDTFLDENIKVDGIIGVSAGALFGVNYVSKQRGRTIRYNKIFINDKRYISFKSLIKTGNIINKEFAYYKLPFELDKFDEKEFEKANIPYYAVITNVETGEAEYPLITNCETQIEELRASSSMPFVSKIVEIDGKKYLDGALADSIPYEKMIELGYDKIIVVLTRDINYRKKKRSPLMANTIYRKYPKLVKKINNRYKMYNDSITRLKELEKEGKLLVIRPSKDLHVKRIEKDIDKLQAMYDLGISDTKDCINNIKEYLKK